MKTIVLPVSRNYPKYHPKAGHETDFIDSILKRIKKGTIRGNYIRWLEIAYKLDEGTHILSLRYWSDKPYRSKQIEFARVSKIDIEEIFITNSVNGFEITLNETYLYYPEKLALAHKEGFVQLEDFENWFQQVTFSGALIEFLELEKV